MTTISTSAAAQAALPPASDPDVQAGTAISALHASEPVIYGRYGYGLAVITHVLDLRPRG